MIPEEEKKPQEGIRAPIKKAENSSSKDQISVDNENSPKGIDAKDQLDKSLANERKEWEKTDT